MSLIHLTAFSQDSLSSELKRLADNKQFDKIIEQYAGSPKNYSAKSLYMIGLAYYMKEDDNNCIKFMNLSIDKDSKDPKAYYIKAATLNYMKQFENAAKTFQSAIALKRMKLNITVDLATLITIWKNLSWHLKFIKKQRKRKTVQTGHIQ